MTKEMKVPGPDHPITIEKNAARVRVHAGGKLVADTKAALMLHEAGYPGVYYIPLADVEPGALEKTSSSTYCPYKGEASYYSLVGADGGTDAVWTYESPYPAVREIAAHVAFYPDRVEITED
ncbi:DUF427 domain-containing protein [Amycolatopsis sp.]|uniref:DUF427 domain-containing protein n=1 Tax=Amycolatopsis sp. TaxID=37632 RepID=UPI002CC72403|nr:DUF427 domain-containing protein [Amycolatopsis sp.]HVV09474.1 DUF427 domain-containing protein [Amycolatopsis sp.]